MKATWIIFLLSLFVVFVTEVTFIIMEEVIPLLSSKMKANTWLDVKPPVYNKTARNETTISQDEKTALFFTIFICSGGFLVFLFILYQIYKCINPQATGIIPWIVSYTAHPTSNNEDA